MNVGCEDCQVGMEHVEKEQNERPDYTVSVYRCPACYRRVKIVRKGTRKEDVSFRPASVRLREEMERELTQETEKAPEYQTRERADTHWQVLLGRIEALEKRVKALMDYVNPDVPELREGSTDDVRSSG